jgi:hypothetical protein
VTRALAVLCLLLAALTGCAHPLSPAVAALNSSAAFLTSANRAMVAAQDAEAAAASAAAPDESSVDRAEDATEARYAPWWSAYHDAWLVWVAGRASVEAASAADAAGRDPEATKVQAAVLRLVEAQARLRDATEALIGARSAR